VKLVYPASTPLAGEVNQRMSAIEQNGRGLLTLLRTCARQLKM
jgi:hypothetical protein